MKWRLGIDIGTNSIGWAALKLANSSGDLRPVNLMDCGSRIFSDGRDPKDNQSNAAKRREPRSARKNLDRYKRRRARLMRQLIQHRLMPEDKQERKALEGGKGCDLADTDPWILRARALDEKLTPHQLGRAIFHLHQRRGFKSNRKTDRADNERGKVHEAIQRTKDQLEESGARTLGERFGKPRLETLRHNQTAKKGERKPQPLARVRRSGNGTKWQYDYYPTRALILDEFDRIWEAQKSHHGALLTDKAHADLRDTIEWQHRLRPQPVGKCTLIPEEERAPKALPSFQRTRVFQEVNALKVGETGKNKVPLTLEQRNAVAHRLLNPTNKTGKVTFSQLRKLLGLSDDHKFNTESEKRKDLQGDVTAAKMMQDDRWGKAWFELDLAAQDEIIDKVLNEEEEADLFAWLASNYGAEQEQAARIADTPLPNGHGNLSKKAIDKIQPFLEADVTVYSDAVKQAGYDHSLFVTGEVFDKGLPYYGYILERSVAYGSGETNDPDEKRYGKVANPTVHVALNQLRAVINDLISRFGAPEQIVLELSRNLPLSAEGKRKVEQQQKENQKANEGRAKRLEEECKVENNYQNRLRLRLYEELEAPGKRCVFSGEQIGSHKLFSEEVEIEHILPFSRTFDDNIANKTLATRKANRDKQNKSPYEAFGHSPDRYDWEDIVKRASELPDNKKWRFAPDAMERYENKERDFLARQLTDNQYISRLAKAYVEAIYGGQGYKGTTNRVWVVTGRLTSDLRWNWGLDRILRGHNEDASDAQKKNRNDHRHHAIDAVVIACIDRAMLKRAADQAKENETRFDDRLLAGMPEPWEGFLNDVEKRVRNVVVSHKPDHGYQGAMHNDTAYGIPKGEDGEPDNRGARKVFTRKPLDSDAFTKPEDLKKIRDERLRNKFFEETQGLTGKDFKTALLSCAYSLKPPVYKVRTEEQLKVIPIKDKKSGKVYKAYKGDSNYCYDIWCDEKGKWRGEVISTFDAYQLARSDQDWWRKRTGREGQPLLMRLRKNDCLQIEWNGRTMIVQVYKFSEGMINMAEHFQGNVSARARTNYDGLDPLKSIQMAPSSLQNANAKRVNISPSGVIKIHD